MCSTLHVNAPHSPYSTILPPVDALLSSDFHNSAPAASRQKKELASKYTATQKLTIQPTCCHLSPLSLSSLAPHHHVTNLGQNILQFKIWITFETSHRTLLLHFKQFVTPQLLTLSTPLNSCSYRSYCCCCSCYFCSSCSCSCCAS